MPVEEKEWGVFIFSNRLICILKQMGPVARIPSFLALSGHHLLKDVTNT
jgi:hypothetical protein